MKGLDPWRGGREGDPGDNRPVRSPCVPVLVAFLLGASAPAAQAQGEPAFGYAAYCDEQGRFTYDGAAQALVQRPAHLRRVYEDAARGDARAKEVVRELEQVFQDFGSWLADETTRPECLGLPELTPGCLPKLGFLDELLGSTPEAARLRDVVAQAYEARARQRGAQNAVILSVVDLLLAHGLAQGVLSKALPQEVRAATGDASTARPAPDFVVTPGGTAYPVPPWLQRPDAGHQPIRQDHRYGIHRRARRSQLPGRHDSTDESDAAAGKKPGISQRLYQVRKRERPGR